MRSDIQGLRGIAVLAVVAYHANLPLPGGFMGVDVFIVISGFVVTQMLQREVNETGTFRLGDFFSRRIRRLVPIYLVVTLVSLILGVIFLSPFGEQQQAASTARWSSVFAANLQLVAQDSYQNLVGNPFRHLWSLAVEEQFYVVFPFVVLIGFFIGMARSWSYQVVLGVVTTLLSIASLWLFLLWSSQGAGTQEARWAFFLMPARLWEFGVGVLAAVLVGRGFGLRTITSQVVGLGALMGLVTSFVFVDDSWRFPGPIAVLPVLATGALLIGDPRAPIIGGSLSWRPLRFLGDISYGWYLWHWPIVVFAAIIFPSHVAALVIASLVALGISLVTYRSIEQPWRARRDLVGRRAAGVLLVSMATVVTTSFAVEWGAQSGYGLREAGASDFEFGLDFELDERGGNMDGSCFLRGLEYVFEDLSIVGRECSNNIASDSTGVLLLGDSNALAASSGLFAATRSLGIRAVAFAGAGCPLLRGVPFDKAATCPIVQESYRQIVADVDPEIVVIVNRLDLYVGPLAHYIDDDHRLISSDGRPLETEKENLRAVANAVRAEVDDLVAQGKKVVVMLQPPPGVITGRTLFEKWFPYLSNADRLGVGAVVEQRIKIRESITKSLNGLPGVVVMDIGTVICGREDFCEAVEGEELLYSDFSHLNNAGSLRLTDSFVEVFSALR